MGRHTNVDVCQNVLRFYTHEKDRKVREFVRKISEEYEHGNVFPNSPWYCFDEYEEIGKKQQIHPKVTLVQRSTNKHIHFVNESDYEHVQDEDDVEYTIIGDDAEVIVDFLSAIGIALDNPNEIEDISAVKQTS